MTPIWKSLIFGEKGTSNYQEKTFRQKLITELSKTNQNGSFTNSFSDNNDLLMNTFTFFISSIFENNYNLVSKNDAAMNLLRKNKVEYDIELDKKKKTVHDLEIKLNTCKKKLKEKFDKINQNFEEIEALKNSSKTKDLYIKKLKTTNSSDISKLDSKIKNLSDKVEEYESDKIDKRKIISELERKLGEQKKLVKDLRQNRVNEQKNKDIIIIDEPVNDIASSINKATSRNKKKYKKKQERAAIIAKEKQAEMMVHLGPLRYDNIIDYAKTDKFDKNIADFVSRNNFYNYIDYFEVNDKIKNFSEKLLKLPSERFNKMISILQGAAIMENTRVI